MSAPTHCSSYMKLYFTASAFTGKTTVFNSFLLVKTREGICHYIVLKY